MIKLTSHIRHQVGTLTAGAKPVVCRPPTQKWRTDAGYFIKAPKQAIDQPFALHVALRRRICGRTSTIAQRAILDCLQHYGVIKNDICANAYPCAGTATFPPSASFIIQVAKRAWRRERSQLIEQLIAAGVDPIEAAEVVARAASTERPTLRRSAAPVRSGKALQA